MSSHLGLLIVFAAFVSVAFSALMRDEPKEQLRFAARLFGGFVGAAFVLSWLIFFLPL